MGISVGVNGDGAPNINSGKPESGISRWAAFLVVAREMFVTTLRSFLEQHGRDFSAKTSGKIKMGLQCTAVPFCLLSLSPDFQGAVEQVMDWKHFIATRDFIVLLTVVVTLYSGLEYTWRAVRVLRDQSET